jgi:hypothetical protein
MQPSYIGDVSENITGVATGITPDGTRVIAVARTSPKNGHGIVVYRSTDGISWVTKFFPTPSNNILYGVAFFASTNTIIGMTCQNATTMTLYRSTNLGDTWETKAVTHGIPQMYAGGLNVLIADEPRNRLIAYNYSSVGQSSSTVKNIAIQSFDNGDTWTPFYTSTVNGERIALGSISNHSRGVVGRIWGATDNLVIYTNSTDNTIARVTTTAPAVAPIDYMKIPLAYNPTYKTYSWGNAANSTGGTGSVLTFNENFTSFVTTSPVITGNARLANIVFYPPTNDTVVTTYKLSTLAQADTKIYKTKTGDGWIEDPTPLYNTAGIQFGPNGIFYDPATGLLNGFIQGSIQQGSGMGYFGIQTNMPTPTPSATMTMTPTQQNNTNRIRLYGRQSVVNSVANTSYSFVSSDGKETLSASLGLAANENIFGSLHVPNTNEIMIWGNYNAVAGDTNTVAISRVDVGGTWNPTFKVTGMGTARNITSVIKIDDDTFIIASASPGRVYKMNASGVVDTTWGTAYTGLSTPNVFHDTTDPTKFYLTTIDRVRRLNISDASLDSSFGNVTVNNPVSALVTQSDGNIIIWGAFTAVNSISRPYLVRLSYAGVVDMTWNLVVAPNGAGTTQATGQIIKFEDDSILVCGGFATVDQISRPGLVKITANGRVDQKFPTFVSNGSYIMGISRMSDGRILVTGNFTTVGGVSRPYVARLLPDGTVDTTFSLTMTTSLQFNSEEYDYPLLTVTPTVTPSITPTHTPVPSAIYNDSLGFGKAVLGSGSERVIGG